MRNIAFDLISISPVCDFGQPQATNSDGLKLWNTTTVIRTERNTKHTVTQVIAANNAIQIRQALKAIARAADDAEKVVPPSVPAPIIAIVGVPVDLAFDPVLDWEDA